MHVAIVMQNDYPNTGEVRPRRLARSLSRHGHQVTLLGWNNRTRPVEEDLGYARVRRFSFFLKSFLYRLLSSPSPLNPFWALWIWKAAKDIRPDLLVASNIRIALPMILAAKVLGKPTILDLQEHNAELAKLNPKTRWVHHLTRNDRLVAWLENACVKWADHTWVVVPERMEDLPPRVVRQRRVTVVSNTAELAEVETAESVHPRKGGEFTLMLIGQVRGTFDFAAPFIGAVGYVAHHGKSVRMIIGGVQIDPKGLDDLAQKLGAQGRVEAEGMIPPEEIPRWLRRGDMGIVPWKVTPFTNMTISNKVFHYMAAGLPVLATAMRPTRRILDEVKCGVVIPEGGGPQEIGEILLRLMGTREELDAMGARGQQAVREKYNWDADYARAFASMQDLLSASRSHVAGDLSGRAAFRSRE